MTKMSTLMGVTTSAYISSKKRIIITWVRRLTEQLFRESTLMHPRRTNNLGNVLQDFKGVRIEDSLKSKSFDLSKIHHEVKNDCDENTLNLSDQEIRKKTLRTNNSYNTRILLPHENMVLPSK